MDEFELINAIKQKVYKQSSLIKGIGDDAAVIRESTEDLVIAVDTFVENVHFARETMDPIHIGYRLLAANLSDLAAMGATPAYYLVSVVIPKEWKEEEITKLFSGMKYLANHYRADLIGGDTVSGNTLVLSITVIGRVKQNKLRYRSGARPNDVVFVTGTLGDSLAGLYLLQNKEKHENRSYFINRHRMPEPRIDFAQALQSIKRVALNDISDGIASEANEIAESSHVTIVIEENKIPVHPGLLQFSEKDQMEWKISGGEDFELLGTVPKKDWNVVKQVAKECNIQITEIGYVKEQEKNPVYLKEENTFTVLKKTGYTHLK